MPDWLKKKNKINLYIVYKKSTLNRDIAKSIKMENNIPHEF